jgi:hypothetical protein
MLEMTALLNYRTSLIMNDWISLKIAICTYQIQKTGSTKTTAIFLPPPYDRNISPEPDFFPLFHLPNPISQT